MSQGTFILSVRVPGNDSFGVLENGDTAQRLKYDDASREKAGRRDATFERVKSAAAGWRDNYKPYANAEFRIEEVDADGVVSVVWGTPYVKAGDNRAIVRKELVTIATAASKRFHKNSQMLSDYLFLEADRAIPTQTAWRALDLEERIEVVLEVAAGFFTPAVAS